MTLHVSRPTWILSIGLQNCHFGVDHWDMI
jgi:hypothetical protein